MKWISRSAWGARKATNGHTRVTSNRGVKIHYLGTRYSVAEHSTCAAYMRKIQNQHMDVKRWADIGYNLAVCEHGYVFEGRGRNAQNAANGSTTLNRNHFAVLAFIGDTGHTSPTTAQVAGIRDAITYLRQHGAGAEIRGHRDGYATACPGDALYALVKSGALEPGGGGSSGSSYTVKSGDTLSGIGGKLGVDWRSIASLNNITSPYTIHPGQSLKIPGKVSAPKPSPVYAPFPGAAYFTKRPNSALISAMGTRLVAEGCGRYQVGPGPQWSNADKDSYAAWQRKLGYRGADADGWPGKASWDALRVPRT